MIMAPLVSALHAFPSTGVLNMKKVEVAYILGAGFSTCAGLSLFTCTDLPAKTGHHLGEPYALSNLRNIWQAPLSRVSSMLQREHDAARKCIGANWSRLTRFFNPEAEFHPFTQSG